MSDGAPNTAEAGAADEDERDQPDEEDEEDEADEEDEGDERDEEDARDARQQAVLRLGAAGCGRAEIARALRMCPEALDQREAEDPGLATALRGAAGLAQAWWEGVAREAFAAGRFGFVAACTREMRRRFGEDGEPAKSKAGRDLRSERRRTVYLLPCNGMDKLNPDGTCPCSSCQREARMAKMRTIPAGRRGDGLEDER